MKAPAVVRVWDLAVRLLHWTLALSIGVAWFTSETRLEAHEAAGYAALAAVAARLAWGIRGGGRYARFRQFVHGPRATARYAALVLARREPRHIGHNPLGGWMAVALLACAAVVAATGWLCTTDRWWGDPAAGALHEGLGWTLVVLVGLHVAGVVYTSLRHRENLPAAMFSGDKRAPSPDDVV